MNISQRFQFRWQLGKPSYWHGPDLLIVPSCCRASRTKLPLLVANILLEVRASGTVTFSRERAFKNSLAGTCEIHLSIVKRNFSGTGDHSHMHETILGDGATEEQRFELWPL
jgi:hypothetical protein